MKIQVAKVKPANPFKPKTLSVGTVSSAPSAPSTPSAPAGKTFKNPLPAQASDRAKQVRTALEAGTSPSAAKRTAAKARRQEQMVGQLKKNKGKVSVKQKQRFRMAAEKRANV